MSNWNGKVRCVVSESEGWKLGKVYKVVNGMIEQENGMSSYIYNDLNHLNYRLASQFEEVLEIPQPHKSLLKSGMKVVYRNGTERYVFLPAGVFMDESGEMGNSLSYYSDDMLFISFNSPNPQDIMETYTEDGELIAKREEKSAKDIRIEELKQQMKDIIDEIAELKDSKN